MRIIGCTHLKHIARDVLELALAAAELARQLHLVALQPETTLRALKCSPMYTLQYFRNCSQGAPPLSISHLRAAVQAQVSRGTVEVAPSDAARQIEAQGGTGGRAAWPVRHASSTAHAAVFSTQRQAQGYQRTLIRNLIAERSRTW